MDEIISAYALPIIIPLVAPFVSTWLFRRRKIHAIEWRTEISGIRIDGSTHLRFFLRNTGERAIDGNAVVKPLTWTGSGRIRAAWVDMTHPTDCVDLRLNTSDNILTVGWKWFNQGCMAVIGILYECDSGVELGTITGQIKDVRRIRHIRTRRTSVVMKICRAGMYLSLAYAVYFLSLTLSGVVPEDRQAVTNIVFYMSLVGVSTYSFFAFRFARTTILLRKKGFQV